VRSQIRAHRQHQLVHRPDRQLRPGNYSASKGAVIAFTKTAALGLARYNVTVDLVAPATGRSESMGETSSTPTLDPFKALGELRDMGMQSWAKIALQVTSSHAYSRLSSVLAKPGLIAAGVARKKTEEVMTQMLARASMPSRADVLSLSVRLTHIEMALDDLAAAVDALRAPPARPPRPAKRASANGRAPRRPAAPREG
jgi:NAD(P)-dependent dehydrogenase (short-subunit alcohol dehydrogenase family)